MVGQGKLLGVDTVEVGTYESVMTPAGVLNGTGQGLVRSNDGDALSWTGTGIGKPTGKGLAATWRYTWIYANDVVALVALERRRRSRRVGGRRERKRQGAALGMEVGVLATGGATQVQPARRAAPIGRPRPSRRPSSARGCISCQRVWAQLAFLNSALEELDAERAALTVDPETTMGQYVHALPTLRGIGPAGTWTLATEIFGWRQIKNRRQLGGLVGLVPAPYQSGESTHDQGITRAGNTHVRRLMVQLAWH